MRTRGYIIALLFTSILWGCGKGNSAAPVTVDPTTKHHPAGWANPLAHGANKGLGAKASAASGGSMQNCRACHGDDFSGGISKVSCFDNSKCHGAGVKSAHQKKPWWISGSVAGTHTSTDPSNAVSCAVCHLNANKLNVNLHPGCYNNTLCHDQNPIAHPRPWNGAGHAPGGTILAGERPYNCGCHNTTSSSTTGAYLLAGVPLCASCHQDSTGNSDHFLNATPGCLDCHGSSNGQPIGTTGASFPNRQFAHALHMGFNGVTCSKCHAGAGQGTAIHGNQNKTIKPAVLASTVGYAGNTVTVIPSPNPQASNRQSAGNGTCSTVSCHGGAITPAWNSTGNNLTANCANCHQMATNVLPALPVPYNPNPVTPQYNSYWSGDGRALGHQVSLHASHLGKAPNGDNFSSFIVCTDCHDPLRLAVNHFKNLGTSAVVENAADSIYTSFGYRPNGLRMTCFTPPSGDSLSAVSGTRCHPGNGFGADQQQDWK